jgi:hypothetical protein
VRKTLSQKPQRGYHDILVKCFRECNMKTDDFSNMPPRGAPIDGEPSRVSGRLKRQETARHDLD